MIQKILFLFLFSIASFSFSQEKAIEKLVASPNPFTNNTTISFKANISHEPWSLCSAITKNSNLLVLDEYKINSQYPQTFYCKEINVTTNTLERI